MSIFDDVFNDVKGVGNWIGETAKNPAADVAILAGGPLFGLGVAGAGALSQSAGLDPNKTVYDPAIGLEAGALTAGAGSVLAAPATAGTEGVAAGADVSSGAATTGAEAAPVIAPGSAAGISAPSSSALAIDVPAAPTAGEVGGAESTLSSQGVDAAAAPVSSTGATPSAINMPSAPTANEINDANVTLGKPTMTTGQAIGAGLKIAGTGAQTYTNIEEGKALEQSKKNTGIPGAQPALGSGLQPVQTPQLGSVTPPGISDTYSTIFGQDQPSTVKKGMAPSPVVPNKIPMVTPPPLVNMSDRTNKTHIKPAERSIKQFLSLLNSQGFADLRSGK